MLIGEAGPLRLCGPRLYLSRYFHFERQVAGWLLDACAPLPTPALQPWLDRLFEPDWSRLQAAWRQQPAGNLADFLHQWLDVVAPESLDLVAIQACLDQASQPDELAALATLIPPCARLDWSYNFV